MHWAEMGEVETRTGRGLMFGLEAGEGGERLLLTFDFLCSFPVPHQYLNS